MGKKPEIFKPNMSFIDNNKKAYYSYLEEPSEREEEIEESTNIQDFLDQISQGGRYVFNRKVVIVTKDKTYNTKIAGKLGNRIITLDNNSIPLEDIVKIYEKK